MVVMSVLFVSKIQSSIWYNLPTFVQQDGAAVKNTKINPLVLKLYVISCWQIFSNLVPGHINPPYVDWEGINLGILHHIVVLPWSYSQYFS